MGKLELTWPGKNDWGKPEPRLLIEEDRYQSKIEGSASTDNLLIHGENLLGLKALCKKYAGAVKCIYIDPPYNTQSSFAHYEDGMEHSAWLNMMKERLVILKKLLREDGSIWISIDDNECHYLKVLCDEIFGRKNFIAEVIWQKRTSRENRAAIGLSHDTILVYGKVPPHIWKKYRNALPHQKTKHTNLDNDQFGEWSSVPFSAQGYRPNQMYKIKTPNGSWVEPPKGRCWGATEPVFQRMLQDGKIYFPKGGTGKPRIKQYADEQKGLVPNSLWLASEVGTTEESKKEILSLFPKNEPFFTPKPERLIHRILTIATNPGDLVLDCFAGSGTTGAVAHKMGRRWIMMEINGPCRTHIVPRLQKVIDGTDQGGISKAVGWEGGGGFQFCELAPSLLEKNSLNRWVVNKTYDSRQLVEAVCLHVGYEFNSDLQPWWLHGKISERKYLHVTGTAIDESYLRRLNNELSDRESLLVCCAAFKGDLKKFPKLSVKKIPKAILSKCEWGKDDYSRNLKKALKDDADLKNKQKHTSSTSAERILVPMAASQGNRR